MRRRVRQREDALRGRTVRSIRTFLLTRLLGGATLVLVLAGAAVFVVVTRSLEEGLDRNLADRVRGLASILFQVGEVVEFEFSDQLMPEYAREHEAAYFELRFVDGRLVEKSESMGEADLVVPRPAGEAPAFWSAPLPDGRPGRYVSQLVTIHHVYPEEGPDRPEAGVVSVVVARGREELVAAELTVLAYCGAVCLGLVLLIAGLSWVAVDRGLEPAKRLAARLDAVRVDDLPERLDAGPLPVELGPVASKIDALIRRVDVALKRERRTTADIAHELRTPISELLTVSEVALRDGPDVDRARRALGTVRDVAWRMSRSVTTLLALARLEMGADTVDRRPVDIGRIVEELLRPLVPVGRERGVGIECRVEAGDLVHADPEVLRIVVSNLLGNAVHYAPRGGVVECRLERARGAWTFVVENDSADLRPEDLRHLSEPFWRKDGARSDRDRSGLGLALSSALAERTGMQLAFALVEGTFRAILSAEDAGPGREADPGSMARRTARVTS